MLYQHEETEEATEIQNRVLEKYLARCPSAWLVVWNACCHSRAQLGICSTLQPAKGEASKYHQRSEEQNWSLTLNFSLLYLRKEEEENTNKHKSVCATGKRKYILDVLFWNTSFWNPSTWKQQLEK